MILSLLLGLIGFICLLLWLGISIPLTLAKLFIRFMSLIHWILRAHTFIMSNFFLLMTKIFCSWDNRTVHETRNKIKIHRDRVNNPILMQAFNDEKANVKRELYLLKYNFPLAEKQILEAIGRNIFRENFAEARALIRKAKSSHIHCFAEFRQKKAQSGALPSFGYHDVESVLPLQQKTEHGITCDIREKDHVFIIVACKEGSDAKLLWHTDAFYKAMELMPKAMESMKEYTGTETVSKWVDVSKRKA